MSLRATLLGITASVLLAASAPGVDVGEVRRCVEENAPERSAALILDVETRTARGGVSGSRLKLYWIRDVNGRSTALMRFRSPSDLAGSALLIAGLREKRPEVHLYLPDLRRAQRITSREQLEGFLGQTSIGLEEISVMLDPIGEQDVELVEAPDGVEEAKTWALQTRREGNGEDPAASVRTFVDRELCLPLRVEYLGAEGDVLRHVQVDVDHIERFARSWVPMRLEATDLESGDVTRIRLEQVEIDIPLAPGLLTVKALGVGG